MRDGGGQCTKACISSHTHEFRSHLAQCFFGELPFRDVLDCSNVFKVAITISRSVGNNVEMLHCAVRHQKATLIVKVLPINRQFHHASYVWSVERMNSSEHQLKCRSG
jgi:hypothetical protein